MGGENLEVRRDFAYAPKELFVRGGKIYSRRGAETQREERLGEGTPPSRVPRNFRFRDLEGWNGREQDSPATMGRQF